MITGKLADGERDKMGSLAALGGVSKFPIRVKCASLAWHALKAALEDGSGEVSTEREGPPQMEGA
jgi:nitrogen fixation NifU-like protein